MNIIVTGANRGIGLSFCTYFNRLGHHVYGVCRQSSPQLETVATVIDNIDISHPASCKSLFEKLSDVNIDLLINNAGILLNESLGQLNFDTIEQQFNVNALGALRITEGLMKDFNQGTKVALITSRMGSIADNSSGGRYGYRMSKAALNAAGKSLAIDLKELGVSVGIFHPGLVSTDMIGGNGDIEPDEAAQRIAGLIEKLTLSNSGTFWHSNGEILPW